MRQACPHQETLCLFSRASPVYGCRADRRLEEGYGLNSGDIKPFSAAHILAADHVVPADHVALGLGETGPIAVVGPAWQLSFFSPNQPAQLVFSLLSTVRARHGVRALFGPFIKKIAFFHPAPRWSAGNFPFASLCHPA